MRFLLIVFLISIVAEAKDYKGAEFRTKNTFRYGRFEVSMKSAHREGILSSFFTYNTNMQSSADWNEIDIEILGRYPNDVQFNTITPGQTSHTSHYPANFSPHTDYHTYAFEWTPQYVAWFIDGTEVYRQTGSHIRTLTKPQKIMMNIWNPTHAIWVGEWNPGVLPAFASYDWMAYYSYTPGTGNYGTGNNFTFSFRDDFDFWNTSRWEKGTHTWDGNGCDFIEENAVIINSKLILCLTDSINIGYTDVNKPLMLDSRVINGKVYAYFSEELDPVSAQNKANFNIVGSTVVSAVLLPDGKTVELSVQGWDFTSARNLLALGVKDLRMNSMVPRALAITLQQPLSFPVKINCAGSSVLGYLADQDWNINRDYGVIDGNSSLYSSGIQINGTDEDEIFRSEKYGMTVYKTLLPRGIYNVKLMFAENYFTQAGIRVFDVYLENNRVLDEFDIFAEAGSNTALIKTFNNINVTDGYLDVYFAAGTEMPLINGIIIDLVALGTAEDVTPAEGDFILNQNYPNPFNGETTFSYRVIKPDNYRMFIYNVNGEKLIEENLGFLNEGYYSAGIDTGSSAGLRLASGVYFLTLANSSRHATKKFILLN